ncbi:hypothetical protein BDN72DRAFT_842266 [Pluteus cervinus]|uniref:Uncharacterized protein n=1 Tax=Pluteus cervinus TaxID=181527 RepID=A0ACD3ARB2_9AGAR|nr:hypothetical protein BDN72DRAFT_842266 [Pluteus cervinus]
MDTVADSAYQVAINIILSGTLLLAGLRYFFDRAITVVLGGGVPLLLLLSSLCAFLLAIASLYHVIHLVCYGSAPDISRFTSSISLANISLRQRSSNGVSFCCPCHCLRVAVLTSPPRDPEIGVHMVPIWVHGADIDSQGHNLHMSGTVLDPESEQDCEIVVPLAPPPPPSARRSTYAHRGDRKVNQGWCPKKFDDSMPRNERLPKEVEMRTVRTSTSNINAYKTDCHHD